MREYPATPAQATAFFLHQAAASPRLQNLQLSLSLGEIGSPEAMKQAWERVEARHPSLRSSFRKAPTGEVIRLENERLEIPWQILEWSQVPGPELSGRWSALLEADAQNPFEIKDGPLLRFHAIRLGNQCHVLMAFSRLLLSEETLFPLLCEWLAALENNLADTAPEESSTPPASSPEIADWWRQALQQASAPAVPLVATPSATAPGRDEIHTEFDRDTTKSLKEFCRVRQVTERDLFTAAASLVLGRLASQRKVLSLSPTASGNILPLLLPLEADASVDSFLAACAAAEDRRSAHDAINLERVFLLEKPVRKLADFPIFLHPRRPLIVERIHSAMPRWINLDARLHESRPFPLSIEWRAGLHLALTLNFDQSFMPRQEADRLSRRIMQAIFAFIQDPGKKLPALPLLLPEEEHFIERSAKPRPRRPLPVEKSIAATAAAQPEAVAIEGPGEAQLTFSELDSHATILASYLRKEHLADGWNIAVCLTPSPWMPVALLAIPRAGDTCLLLDHQTPAESLVRTVQKCDIELIICDSRTATLFEKSERKLLVVDQQWETVTLAPLAPPSTKPLKVALLLPQEAADAPLRRIAPDALALACGELADFLNFQPGDRVAVTLPANTGAFAETTLASLLSGATLALPLSEDPLDFPPNASHLRLSAAQWRTWIARCQVSRAAVPAELLTVSIEAASLPSSLLAAWKQLAPAGSRLAAFASPAGLCGLSVASLQNAEDLSEAEIGALIGSPRPLVKAYLQDIFAQPLPPLYVGNLEISAENLKTDLPAWRDFEGQLHLKESAFAPLEKAVASFGGLLDVFAANIEDDGRALLCAWIVPATGSSEVPSGFREHLRKSLPPAQVPDAVLALAEFPLDDLGRLDVAALPRPTVPKAAPASSSSTPASASAKIVSKEWDPLVSLSKTSGAPTLICVHGLEGTPAPFRTLATLLAGEWNIYSTTARGIAQPGACHATIETEAASLIEAICLLDPDGPYHLFGHGFGATLAFEMARQFRIAGRQVPYLILAGSPPPPMAEKGGWAKSFSRLFSLGRSKPPETASSLVGKAHLEARKAYQALPLGGGAGLILGADQGPEVEAGWMECVPEAFIERMSCQAGEMLAEPAVKRLANILRDCALPEEES